MIWYVRALLLSSFFRVSGAFAETQIWQQQQTSAQCVRHRCLNQAAETCREYRPGLWNERGCKQAQACTNCYNDTNNVAICKCETLPYVSLASYNEPCGEGRDCEPGTGLCFRPCQTFALRKACPENYCYWDQLNMKCQDKMAREHRGDESKLLAWTSVQGSESAHRRLQAAASEGGMREACNARTPRQFYCSLVHSCVDNCLKCGRKSATDQAFATCVQPTPSTCYADDGRVYCASDRRCHPKGDCSDCVDRPIMDHFQHACLARWWDVVPLQDSTHWVCRWRNNVGMPCTYDQDCLHGLRRCLAGYCAPFRAYNESHSCVSDHDCPHIGFYCPSDPSGGANSYWVKYCRRQRSAGMTCRSDRECEPGTRCNNGEAQPRCRKLFFRWALVTPQMMTSFADLDGEVQMESAPLLLNPDKVVEHAIRTRIVRPMM